MVSVDAPPRPSAPEPRAAAGERAPALAVVVAVAAFGLLAAGLAIALQPGADGWQQVRDLLSQLRHHVVQDVPANLGAPVVVLAFTAWCALLGATVLRALRLDVERFEEVVLGAVAGALPAMVVILVVGTTIGLATPTLLVTGAVTAAGAVAVLAVRRPVTARPPLRRALRALRPDPVQAVLVFVLAALLLMPFLASLQPETNWDGHWYHLGPARHYVDNGSFYNTVAETGMAVTALPSYDETLRTGIYGLRGDVAAKALSFAEMLVLLGLLVATAKRFLGSVTIGLLAGVALCAVPVATWAASTSYVDLAMGMVTLAMFYAALRHRREPSWRWLVLLGLLGGYVIGVKLFGVFGLIGCAAVAVWPERWDRATLRRLVAQAVQGGAAVLVGWAPGLVRSAVQTGNPVFPLLPGLFPSDYWNDARQSESLDGLHPISFFEVPVKLLRVPYDTVVDADRLNTLVGPVFLVLLPLLAVAALVLGRRRRPARLGPGLLVPAAVVSVLWIAAWLKLGLPDTRYLLAIMPIAMLGLAGLAASIRWSRAPVAAGAAIAVFAVLVVVGSPYTTRVLRQSDPNQGNGTITLLFDYLYNGAPASDYTEPPAVKAMNDLVPPGGKVLITTGTYTLYEYIRPEILAYSPTDGPPSLRTWSVCNADAPWRLKDAGVTHILTIDVAGAFGTTPIAPYVSIVTHTADGLALYEFDASAIGPEPQGIDHSFCAS